MKPAKFIASNAQVTGGGASVEKLRGAPPEVASLSDPGCSIYASDTGRSYKRQEAIVSRNKITKQIANIANMFLKSQGLFDNPTQRCR
jgi:hypothetical protein